MQQRLNSIRRLMAEKELDGALLTSGVHIRYASGFTSSDGVVLVAPKRCYLFTDFRYTIQAKEQLFGGYELVEFARGKLMDDIAAALSENGCKRCGFEQDNLSVARFEQFSQKLPVELKPFGDELASLRRVKSDQEIASMLAAQRIADQAYAELLKRIQVGMTEREAVAELLYICARLGSEGPSFDPIVGSGPNGAMCHAIPGDRKLKSGDLVVVDFGCVKDGYCSDMTRTFGIGSLEAELVKIYGVTLDAQRAALDLLKPGVTGAELDAAARGVIERAGYGDCFGHGLGHGVGLRIHEAPSASPGSTDTFVAGNSITVEPGVYLEGRGGVRIEDCCILQEGGYLDLTHSPKELVIL